MKKWLALLLAVLMLCAMTGCGDKSKPDDKDTPTTTTTTTTTEPDVVPIELIEGEIPADSLACLDATAPAKNHAVLLKACIDLIDLHFIVLNPDPPTIGDTIHTFTSLQKGQHTVLYTYVNDAVPTRGVSCTDKDGKTYYYAITYSMKGDGSPSLSLTALDIEELSEEKLDEINTFLNDPDNLGFVQRTFDRPQEVQWIEVLTADVTFGVDEREWSDAERQALANALEYDMSGSPIRYPRAKVEELFQKRLDIPLSALEKPISAVYLAEYDAYYRSFLSIEWVPIYVKSGKIENGIYIVDYSFDNHDATRRVTMRATNDGFQFISNVAIED